MDMGADIFESLYAELPAARISVRLRGREVIARGLSSGIDISDRATDEGLLMESGGNVRFLRDEEPDRRAGVGDVIEYKAAHMARYRKVKVSSRADMGGLVTLEVKAEYD